MSLLNKKLPIDDRMALRLREAAQALGISQRTMWDLVDRGEIKSFRASRNIHLVQVTELKRWMDERTAAGQPKEKGVD